MSGALTVINATPHGWVRSGINSYQMDQWDFPETIPAGTMVDIPVTFATGTGVYSNDDAGDVSYDILDVGGSFSFAARNSEGYDISVTMSGYDTKTHNDGDVVDLGFIEGGDVHYFLSGSEDAYNDPLTPMDWMQQNMGTLGARKLRHVCMPGSHDAGMYGIGEHTGLATPANTRTQGWDIQNQLLAGSRFFDIRPVISGGEFYTGHYSDLGGSFGWQGANGQPIEEIIDQINEFTSDNAELIIIDLSHAYDTDNGYGEFNQDQWNSLFDALDRIDNKFLNPTGAIIQDLTMYDFIGNGYASVVILAELSNGATIDGYNYVFTLDQFGGIYNNYASSDDAVTMMNDQLQKLTDNRQITGDEPKEGFFVLSWTLTQSAEQIIGGEASSILDMAASVYGAIFVDGFMGMSKESYPNVLYMDLFGSGISQDSDSPLPMPLPPKRRSKAKRDQLQRRGSKAVPGADGPTTAVASYAMVINALAKGNPLVATGPGGDTLTSRSASEFISRINPIRHSKPVMAWM